ncbi:MAG: CtkA family protein [Bacilli bacterium]|nr:CtkA family protein [Bacilli bacterium]
MIKIENFDLMNPSGISYGGHGGSKRGIIINNERWFLKYPKSTKSMDVEGLSYSTTPLSEYLGSHIYESIGLRTHETKLGIANGKIVVACKDFLGSSEMIIDYNMIKNEYDENVEKAIEYLSSSSNIDSNHDLEEILLIMEENPYFKSIPELKERFWDMFVIDAFISNNDRNESNWGLVLNKETNELRLSPVFDNGAAFYNKSNDEKLTTIYNDNFKFKQSVYDSSVSIYRLNGKRLNPLKYIESMDNAECNKAILRMLPKINMDKIISIFEEVPEEYNGLPVLSEAQKTYYLKSLEYKYDNVLIPIYNKLLELGN